MRQATEPSSILIGPGWITDADRRVSEMFGHDWFAVQMKLEEASHRTSWEKLSWRVVEDCSGAAVSGLDLLNIMVIMRRKQGGEMLFEIKSWISGKVVFSFETKSMKLAVEAAVEKGIDLSGADLSRADLRGADLSGAFLSCAVLRGADLSGAVLSGADLSRADLRGADLSGAFLSCAVLRGADLSRADLSRADLSDVPVVENIDAKILEAIETHKAAGLDMSSWHGEGACNEENWCETTHCRAGYAICLAGKAGFELEREVGPATAGALIYLKSTPNETIPDFYASNQDAMADIRARAAKQIAGA